MLPELLPQYGPIHQLSVAFEDQLVICRKKAKTYEVSFLSEFWKACTKWHCLKIIKVLPCLNSFSHRHIIPLSAQAKWIVPFILTLPCRWSIRQRSLKPEGLFERHFMVHMPGDCVEQAFYGTCAWWLEQAFYGTCAWWLLSRLFMVHVPGDCWAGIS